MTKFEIVKIILLIYDMYDGVFIFSIVHAFFYKKVVYKKVLLEWPKP